MSADKLILALLLLPQSAAAELEVYPSNLSTELTSGSDYSYPLSVQWRGEQERAVGLNLSISAEDSNTKGISASLSHEVLSLSPGESREVELQIDTSYGLEPDNFTMKLEGRVNRSELQDTSEEEQESPDESDSGGGGFSVPVSGSEKKQETGDGLKPAEGGPEQNETDQDSGGEDNRSQPDSTGNISSKSRGEFTRSTSTGVAVAGILALVFLSLVILKI